MPVNNELADQVWTRYQKLRDNGHIDYVLKANKCEDFFFGQQWDQKDLAYLKSVRRPALTINKIISTLANVMGEQIYNRTDIAFKPRNEGATSEVADALTKVFMQISDNNQLPWVRSDVFADGIIGSRGFYDIRLDFTDSLKGELKIQQLNPKNVLIDKDADAYDPESWGDVIHSKWMSVDDIELTYSAADAKILQGRGNSYVPYGADTYDNGRDRFGTASMRHGVVDDDPDERVSRHVRVIDRQWRKLDKVEHFVDIRLGDMRQVPRDWDRERIGLHLEQNPNLAVTKKLIKRVRWTVVADNVVLHDDWSPYKHFTIVPFFPYFVRGRTCGLVENLIDSQELLNKTSSQELHVVNTTANSGWKLKTGALKNMSAGELENRGAQTGLVIELDDINNAEKIQPNQTPTGLDRISYKAEEHIKTISGVSDYALGSAREDVSAKSVLANKSSGQTNLAKVIDNLGRTDTILARTALSMIQDFYTEERLIKITKDKLQNTVEEIKVNEVTPEGTIINDLTLGEYLVVTTSQPERDTFEEGQFDQAVRLRTEVGVQIPDRFIIQSSRLRDKAAIISALEGNQDSPEAQAAAQLAAREREAQVATAEAQAQKIAADAQLSMAKAQAEAAGGGGAEEAQAKLTLEAQKIQQDHALAVEKMEREFALKKELMDREFEMKRQEQAQEQALKRQTEEADVMTRRMAAIEQARQTQASAPAATKE